MAVGFEIEHAFGSLCGSGIRDAALFGDISGDTLVYLVGRQVALRHLGNLQTNFVVESDRVQAVSALATSRDRRFLAVCERCSQAPLTQVSVYNLTATDASEQPEQTLEEFGGQVGRLVSCTFSCDEASTRLCVASETPQLLLVVLEWRSNVVLGRCHLPCDPCRVSFSPLVMTTVSMSGSNCLRLWSTNGADISQDAELCPFEVAEGLEGSFTDHAWLEPGDDRLAACTAEGLIFILGAASDTNEGEQLVVKVLQKLDAPFRNANNSSADNAAHCLRCFNGGIVFGGSHGLVGLWKQQLGAIDNAHSVGAFVHVLTVRVVELEYCLSCLDIAGHGDSMRLVFGLSNSSLLHCSVAELHAASFEHRAVRAEAVDVGGSHTGGIAGLDVAARRSLAVSVGSEGDQTIRVWDYATKCCELSSTFPGEEPLAVAVHPQGYLFAASFSDKLRFLQILVDELRPLRELSVSEVQALRFSAGGHFLAAAHGKTVMVFDTRLLAKAAPVVFRAGLTAPIVTLSFEMQDSILLACCDHGQCCKWSVGPWTQLEEGRHRPGSLVEGSMEGDESPGRSKSKLAARRLRAHHCTPEEAQLLPEGVQLSCSVRHTNSRGTTLLAGSFCGTLFAVTLVPEPSCIRLGLHAAACIAVSLSGDAQTLITAGEDGVVFVVRLSGLAEADPAYRSRFRPNCNIVMTDLQRIQTCEEEIVALMSETDKLKQVLEEGAARLETESSERVKAAREKDQEKIRSLRQNCETLQLATTLKERQMIQTIKALENVHVQAADSLEQRYEGRINTEAEQLEALQAQVCDQEALLEHACLEARKQQDEQHRQQKNTLKATLREKDAEIARLKDVADFSQHRFEIMLEQERMEHDMHISQEQSMCESDLEHVRNEHDNLKKEQDGLVRRLDVLGSVCEQGRREHSSAQEVEAAMRVEAEGLKVSVASLKETQRKVETAIRAKESELNAYRAKVNTLKKFRRVLDFRLREITESLEPKDKMIQHLRSQIGELEGRLTRQLSEQQQKADTFHGQLQQMREMGIENDRLREVVKHRERSIEAFRNDLRALVTEELDMRRWPQGICKIYRDHAKPELLHKDSSGEPGFEELDSQVSILQRKTTTLKACGRQGASAARADLERKTSDNNNLIREADVLRAERKVLGRQLRDLEMQVTIQQRKDSAAEVETGAASPQHSSADNSGPVASITNEVEETLRTGVFLEDQTQLPSTQEKRLHQPQQQLQQQQQHFPSSKKTMVPQQRMRRNPSVRVTPEERKQRRQAMAAAESDGQKIHMQRLEQKLLSDFLQSQGGSTS